MVTIGGLARLSAVRRHLSNGGVVRFTHNTCQPILIFAEGKSFQPIDGRSYQAFQSTADSKYTRTQTGSVETHNLIIEWRS